MDVENQIKKQMGNTTAKTELINKEQAETSFLPTMVSEMGELLKFTTANQTQKKALFLQSVGYGQMNFERKSDWMRLINKLNRYDDTPIKRILTGDSKTSDWGDMIISRIDVDYDEDGFMIEFKEPVKLIVEEIGDNYLTIEVSKIQGKTTYEWWYAKTDNDLEGYADTLEVFIYDVEIIE
jgi:hypothetical protein